jgi:hypothetical protein
MFIRVNLKCAHQVRPPPPGLSGKACLFGSGPNRTDRCLEESGVIQRVEEAGMTGQSSTMFGALRVSRERVLRKPTNEQVNEMAPFTSEAQEA